MPSKPRLVPGPPVATAIEFSARCRITIAEDDEEFLFLVRHLISHALPQTCIDAFSNAEDALAHILDAGTNILITDHAMGDMSGAELIRQLRARGFTLPIIMISGNPQAEEEARQAGVTEFLGKDVPLEAIAHHVRRLLPA